MIVVDTSALIAMLRDEPEAEALTHAIFDARVSVIAAPTALEFFMVAEGQRTRFTSAPQDVFARSGVIVQPWTEQHLAIARDAFARYGKGRGHPAQLNFGDCMSYALAKSLDVPLLYKGDDFVQTDIRSVL